MSDTNSSKMWIYAAAGVGALVVGALAFHSMS
jgi:hypothetical protein